MLKSTPGPKEHREMLSVRLPSALVMRLKAFAVANRYHVQELVETWITERLDVEDAPGKSIGRVPTGRPSPAAREAEAQAASEDRIGALEAKMEELPDRLAAAIARTLGATQLLREAAAAGGERRARK